MTRSEEIIEAAKPYIDDPKEYHGFIMGADWADNHPDIGVASALAYEAGQMSLMERACKWLATNYEDIGIRWMRDDEAEDFVEQFKKEIGYDTNRI